MVATDLPLLGLLLLAPTLLLLLCGGGSSGVMQQELAQALHGQHVQGALAGLHQVSQPGHGLGRGLQGTATLSSCLTPASAPPGLTARALPRNTGPVQQLPGQCGPCVRGPLPATVSQCQGAEAPGGDPPTPGYPPAPHLSHSGTCLPLDDVEEKVRVSAPTQQVPEAEGLVEAFYLVQDVRGRPPRGPSGRPENRTVRSCPWSQGRHGQHCREHSGAAAPRGSPSSQWPRPPAPKLAALPLGLTKADSTRTGRATRSEAAPPPPHLHRHPRLSMSHGSRQPRGWGWGWCTARTAGPGW